MIMNQYLLFGIILGLSAGFSPGPLMTLVLTETLQHNVRSGIKVAMAPILTDVPIVLLSLFVLTKLAFSHSVLGIISFGGALFLLCLGWQSLQTKAVKMNMAQTGSQSLSKGILTNFLSPHPYLFWISVGGPMMTRAMDLGLSAGILFIGGFYFCLVGSKVLLAILVGKSKAFLSGSVYPRIIQGLGVLLIILAGLLFYDGLKLLKIIV